MLAVDGLLAREYWVFAGDRLGALLSRLVARIRGEVSANVGQEQQLVVS